MPRFVRLSVFVCLLTVGSVVPTAAQDDDRADYPGWLARGAVEFGIGNIDYLFSPQQLEPGHKVESVHVPNLAARLALAHRFTDRLSLRLSYLRPARWVQYRNLNGDASSHSVWMNVAGLSLRRHVPIGPRLSLYGEGGVGVVTRHGIEVAGATVVKDVVYPSPLLAAGAEYRVNPQWGLVAGATFLPGHSEERQPSTAFMSGAVTYRVQRRPPTADRGDVADRPIFREHLFQVGLTTSAFGDRVNTLMAPVFWQGDIAVKRGVAVDYQRNVFHTKKLFSLDLGASVAYQKSRERGDRFVTVSVFPVLRFTMVRTPAAAVYLAYSVAGPTFISRFIIDGQESGRQWTMRDVLGLGMYVGPGRHLNAEVRIGHYSNGNLLPRNSGIKVPLTMTLGYAF
jgi:hypothetical protein